MADPFDYLDEFDVIAALPATFENDVVSKKWTERRDALQAVLEQITEKPKLAPKADYNNFVGQLKTVVEKDANVNVAALAVRILSGLAFGLRSKFAPHATYLFAPLFEKFKEKKPVLRDPVIECVDGMAKTINLENIVDDVVAAMGNKNPTIKAQVDNFIFRQLTRFVLANHPKKFVKAVVPVLVKHGEDSDKDVREAALAALGSVLRLTGDGIFSTLIGPLSGDQLKMGKIREGKQKAEAEFAEHQASQASSEAPAVPVAAAAAPTAVAAPVATAAVSQPVEQDPWDFVDPVDILSKLPENFEELVSSKKWQERKEVLEALLALATDNIRLCPKANYGEIVDTLTKLLGKDPNINVAALAAKCLTQLATGLRGKFAPHAPSVVPVIFEKFKEKKVTLRDPLVATIDAIYSTTTLEVIADDIAAALGNRNPNIKIQTNLFCYRVFKAFNVQTAPKKVVKQLAPLIAKCTGESDAEAREASFSALGAIMKAIGKTNALTLIGDVASDKMKMEQIEKFYNQAVQESGIDVVSEMVQSIHKAAPTEAAKTAVKPRGKAAPAPPPEDSDDSEEPLKPIGGAQADEDLKNKRRSASSNKRRSTAPAKKSPEPQEPSGMLSAQSSRAARLKDEKSLKALKWNFKAPTEEHLLQLQAQFTDVAKPELVKLLFSKDFKQHIKALELIASQLQSEPFAVVNNCDLILKWASLRFFDTNPQSLNKTLEVISVMLGEMDDLDARLNESDVASFIPFMLMKAGDTKEVVRQLVRKSVAQTCVVSVPAKIFPHIIDALQSKNSRQKAECLYLAEMFIDAFGLSACTSPQKDIRAISNCIAEKDSTVRTAALNCIVTASRKEGDKIWHFVQLQDKEKAMLAERVRRSAKEPPFEAVYRLVPKDQACDTMIMPPHHDETMVASDRRSTSRNRPSTAFGDLDGGGVGTTPFTDRTYVAHNNRPATTANTRVVRAPAGGKFKLSARHYDPLPIFEPFVRPKINFRLQPIDITGLENAVLNPPNFEVTTTATARLTTAPPARRNEVPLAVSNGTEAHIDEMLASVSSQDLDASTAATSRLLVFLREQCSTDDVLTYKADAIALALATQLSIVRSVYLLEENNDARTNDLLKYICNLLTFFVSKRDAVFQITHRTISLLLSELLRIMCDDHFTRLNAYRDFLRSINLTAVKLCETAEAGEGFVALISLFDRYLQTSAPSRVLELLCKCYYKQSESFVSQQEEVELDRIVIEWDRFLEKYQAKTATGNVKKVVDCQKLVLQRFVVTFVNELPPYVELTKEDGFMRQYLSSCFDKLKNSSENLPPSDGNTSTTSPTPRKPKSLQDLFAAVEESWCSKGVARLYYHVKTHPDDTQVFEIMRDNSSISQLYKYIFDEFENHLNLKSPRPFHDLYHDFEIKCECDRASRTRQTKRAPLSNVSSASDIVDLPFDMTATGQQLKATLNVSSRQSVGPSDIGGPLAASTPIKKQTMSVRELDAYQRRLTLLRNNR